MKTKTISAILCLVAVFMLPFVVTAQDAGEVLEVAEPVAAAVDASQGDVLEIGATIIAAAKGGEWRMAIAAILSLIMTLAYKLKVRKLSIFKGDRGGVILLLVLGLMGGVSAALASGAPISLDLAIGTLSVVLTAAGGWQVLKRLVWPKDRGDEPPESS